MVSCAVMPQLCSQSYSKRSKSHIVIVRSHRIRHTYSQYEWTGDRSMYDLWIWIRSRTRYIYTVYGVSYRIALHVTTEENQSTSTSTTAICKYCKGIIYILL